MLEAGRRAGIAGVADLYLSLPTPDIGVAVCETRAAPGLATRNLPDRFSTTLVLPAALGNRAESAIRKYACVHAERAGSLQLQIGSPDGRNSCATVGPTGAFESHDKRTAGWQQHRRDVVVGWLGALPTQAHGLTQDVSTVVVLATRGELPLLEAYRTIKWAAERWPDARLGVFVVEALGSEARGIAEKLMHSARRFLRRTLTFVGYTPENVALVRSDAKPPTKNGSSLHAINQPSRPASA